VVAITLLLAATTACNCSVDENDWDKYGNKPLLAARVSLVCYGTCVKSGTISDCVP